MWPFTSREMLPHRQRHQLASSNRMRDEPDGTMQGHPAFKHKCPVAKAHVCQDSNRPRRVSNKLRKDHRHTICSSSDRPRIVCPKRASYPPRIRPSNITKNTSSSQQLPKVMLECRASKAQKLFESTEARSRRSKLQKKGGNNLPNKKSHIKNANEHSERACVKDMATYYSTQPLVATTASVNSAGLRKRKRKINRSGEKYPPDSSPSTSLDIHLSSRSSLSEPSNKATAYMLSTLDALSARPTIKYASKPRYVPPSSHTTCGLKNDDIRIRRTTISEAELMASKRVDRLADRLSAHELRELMERDKKRKEKKKTAELARMERRLNRCAEIQTSSSATDHHEYFTEHRPQKNAQRPHLAQNMSEPIFGSKQKNLGHFEKRMGIHNSGSFNAGKSVNKLSDPITQCPTIADPGSDKTILTSTLKRVDPVDETNPTKKAKRTSLTQYLTLRFSTCSAASTLPTEKINKPHLKTHQYWSIFKLGSKNKRESIPPSFSTTSRESLPSGIAPHSCHTPMRSVSSIPKRTVSKFREDLPDFSISSQSPRTISSETQELHDRTSKPKINEPVIEAKPCCRNVLTNDQNNCNFKKKANRISASGHIDRVGTFQDHKSLSQSLAPADSEASWLSSGRRRLKKTSKKAQKSLKSKSFSKNENYQQCSGPATKEKATLIDKEDYFSRRSTDNSDIYAQSSVDRGEEASSENEKWGAVARQPHIIHSSSAAHRSRHGTLNEIEVDSPCISLETSKEVSD
ncbi:hypothetical protein EV44_g6462 [Erysiphe necator]|uniref:Uncharacterized protein n=1 Tax=Uncinula necator TaxID=52586 RepID=A0A0B1PAI7_UNCNE|nr:hypothetical protein EV44_g6462 [Erysiphe necator]